MSKCGNEQNCPHLGHPEFQFPLHVYRTPCLHSDDALKVFTEFLQTFELRYAALYPDPPKVSMDAAIARWNRYRWNRYR